MRKNAGFTLIELMIVIAIIAIIALIAIPNLLSSRLVANETSTIGTLRSMSAAQAEFQARQIVDQNANGLGEYGFLVELAGVTIPRGAAQKLDPPAVSQALGNVDANGLVTKSGYTYIFWLPSGAGAPIQEPAAGVTPPAVAADSAAQESRWCCYAVPTTIRSTGNRTFVINQQADVYATPNSGVQNYDITNLPAAMAAFETTAPAPTNLMGKFAVGVGAAQDGGTWTPAS